MEGGPIKRVNLEDLRPCVHIPDPMAQRVVETNGASTVDVENEFGGRMEFQME